MTLIELGLYFALLSLLTFGGVSSVIPEMQRYIVDVKGWTTAADFMHLFAVAQAAPGPNVLFTSLIGYRVAGIAGSLVALLGLCAPAAALTWVVSTLWERVGDSPWRTIIRRALAPLVVGLTFAGGRSCGSAPARVTAVRARASQEIEAAPQGVVLRLSRSCGGNAPTPNGRRESSVINVLWTVRSDRWTRADAAWVSRAACAGIHTRWGRSPS